MSSHLQQLENNEAVLLMFLAGELPDADRTEVEQMLAGDPALRQGLADLIAMQEYVGFAFSQADAAPLFSRREAAVRSVSQAITAAKLAAFRAPKPVAPPARTGPRIAFWAYPVAAAALLVIGMIFYPGWHSTRAPDEATPNSPYAVAMGSAPVEIIPVVSTDDGLSQIQDGLLSLRSSGNELDLFGNGGPEIDRQ